MSKTYQCNGGSKAATEPPSIAILKEVASFEPYVHDAVINSTSTVPIMEVAGIVPTEVKKKRRRRRYQSPMKMNSTKKPAFYRPPPNVPTGYAYGYPSSETVDLPPSWKHTANPENPPATFKRDKMKKGTTIGFVPVSKAALGRRSRDNKASMFAIPLVVLQPDRSL